MHYVRRKRPVLVSILTVSLCVALDREEHPELVECMTKKGSNVPEKARTPQQLWYTHEKKAFLKTHADVSFPPPPLPPPAIVFC